MTDHSGVTGAFLNLESIMARIEVTPTETKKETLGGIFLLNSEIGKSLMREPQLSAELRKLQLAINAVTAAIKRDDFASARTSLEAAEEVLREFSRS